MPPAAGGHSARSALPRSPGLLTPERVTEGGPRAGLQLPSPSSWVATGRRLGLRFHPHCPQRGGPASRCSRPPARKAWPLSWTEEALPKWPLPVGPAARAGPPPCPAGSPPHLLSPPQGRHLGLGSPAPEVQTPRGAQTNVTMVCSCHPGGGGYGVPGTQDDNQGPVGRRGARRGLAVREEGPGRVRLQTGGRHPSHPGAWLGPTSPVSPLSCLLHSSPPAPRLCGDRASTGSQVRLSRTRSATPAALLQKPVSGSGDSQGLPPAEAGGPPCCGLDRVPDGRRVGGPAPSSPTGRMTFQPPSPPPEKTPPSASRAEAAETPALHEEGKHLPRSPGQTCSASNGAAVPPWALGGLPPLPPSSAPPAT